MRQTPDIGKAVLRFKDGAWAEDWCIMIRIEKGEQFPNARKALGENVWVEYGAIVWGTDLQRHKPKEDLWKEF